MSFRAFVLPALVAIMALTGCGSDITGLEDSPVVGDILVQLEMDNAGTRGLLPGQCEAVIIWTHVNGSSNLSVVKGVEISTHNKDIVSIKREFEATWTSSNGSLPVVTRQENFRICAVGLGETTLTFTSTLDRYRQKSMDFRVVNP